MSLPIITEQKECQECFELFIDAKYGDSICHSCRKMRALERIADVLEYYVGNL